VSEGLADVEKEIRRCSRCGKCRSVCPVFAEVLAEPLAARGKIALARAALDGDIRASRVLSDRMTLCLNCKACVTNCPAEVRADEVILGARNYLHEEGKSPFLKRAFMERVWAKGRVFARFVETAARLEPLLFAREETGSGRSRVALPGFDRERRVPLFEPSSFLSRTPEVVSPEIRPRGRVALFLGCAANWVYPGVAASAIEALRASGVEVVIPKTQECCGVPMLNAGDFENARRQMEKNRRAFGGLAVDAVVTACASCGLALKKEMEEVLGGGPYFENTAVFDFSEFLAGGRSDKSDPSDLSDRSNVPAKPGSSDAPARPLRVTYHDPCHLVRGQKIVREPRSLLKAVPGIELVEMREPDRCCGGGGLFSLSHYEVAMKIGARKAAAIVETGAEVVATSCPACMIQLTDALARAGSRVRVAHVAELVGRATGKNG
jgi:glycolate oxidase iron-sulfur subunit